jgi:uncharacterized protein with FMN-binding domain/ferredoxin
LISAIVIGVFGLLYYAYLKDLVDFRWFSLGDLNPYGGWSAIKASFMDLSYRWRGVTQSIALSIAITGTSLFFGRLFCGYLCPVGALQDAFKAVGEKVGLTPIKLRKIGPFHLEWMKYGVLGALLVASVLERGHYVSPYSPWLAYLNMFSGFSFGVGGVVLLVLVVGSLRTKRWFCRLLCPLGAFQALLYALGPMKIKKTESCEGCSACFKDCPVEIVNETEVISPECVNCLNCTQNNCHKGQTPYQTTIVGKKIKKGPYLAIGLSFFLMLFVWLPFMAGPGQSSNAMVLEGLVDGVYHSNGTGFGGQIQVTVTISQQQINQIQVVHHKETEGYYEEVFKALSQEVINTQNLNVDTISGATVTSRGFINAIRGGVGMGMPRE